MMCVDDKVLKLSMTSLIEYIPIFFAWFVIFCIICVVTSPVRLLCMHTNIECVCARVCLCAHHHLPLFTLCTIERVKIVTGFYSLRILHAIIGDISHIIVAVVVSLHQVAIFCYTSAIACAIAIVGCVSEELCTFSHDHDHDHLKLHIFNWQSTGTAALPLFFLFYLFSWNSCWKCRSSSNAHRYEVYFISWMAKCESSHIAFYILNLFIKFRQFPKIKNK